MAGKPPTYINIHGRKQGRGLRPFLLIIKILALGVCLGTLTALIILFFRHAPPTDQQGWTRELDILSQAYRVVILPSLITAMAAGGLLALDHPTIFLRMRWLQAKLIIIAVFFPMLHITMRSRMIDLREAVNLDIDERVLATIRQSLAEGTLLAIVVLVLLIILGRIKPRLGQDYGRTFGTHRRVPEETE